MNIAAPLHTFPKQSDAQSSQWSGINKPIKVVTAEGDEFVAKSNTYGKFIGLHPDHDVRMTNVREVVASHIVADELGLPTLTFQEGVVEREGQEVESILSPLRKDFQTLDKADLSTVRDQNQAVKLAITLGWFGDHDTTFNDSNLWLRNDGVLMGADYGFSGRPGIEAAGVPFANLKVLNQFGTRENIRAAAHSITSLSDEDIHGMVERQGKQWIHDWSPAMEQSMSDALIANRDRLRDKNVYLDVVEGHHPLLHHNPLSKLNALRFHWQASHSHLPPLNRPDQMLDVLAGAARVAHLKPLENFLNFLREHVSSPECEQRGQESAVGK